MPIKLRTSYLVLSLIIACSSLTACGGKRAKAEKQVAVSDTSAASDITLPPSVTKEVVEEEVERDGSETFSYEEWLRRRNAGSLPGAADE